MVAGLLAGTAMAQPYTQSPYLDARVASGELPPVEERLPDEPMVFEPLSEIGVYGGQFNVFSTTPAPWNDLTEEPARGPFLLELTQDGEFIPGIARDWDFSEDFTTFTLYLRPGMKWSNGDPFTSADFAFKRNVMGEEFDVAWTQQQFGTPEGTVETPDDYTVILHLGAPIPKTLLNMVHWKGGEWSLFHPSNYLSQWHPDFNEDAETLAAEEGFATWQEAFDWHAEFNPLNDANKPTTQPWMPLEFSTTGRLYERNPYFHQVDPTGQQLPYVDRILSQIVEPETYNLKIIGGEADIALNGATFDNFTLYKENEEAGNYTVHTLPSFQSGFVVFHPNLSHPDPVTRELYNTLEFRQALSVAIDREEINDLIFSGMGVPLQHTVVRTASFYRDEWGENFAQFDPDLANELLDGIGLTERNSAGIRLRPDGDPITIIIEVGTAETPAFVSINELVKEYWSNVGINVELRTMGGDGQAALIQAMEFDMLPDKEDRGELYVTQLDDVELQGIRNQAWTDWFRATAAIEAGTKTLDDFADGVMPGQEPPPEIQAWWRTLADLKLTETYGAEYNILATEYWQHLSDNLYTIGTVGETPFLIIARSNIGNIPDRLPPWLEGKLDINHFANQWFFKPTN